MSEVMKGDVAEAMVGLDTTGATTAATATDAEGGEGAGGGAGMMEQTVIPNLAMYVVINPSLTIFNQQPQLKRIVPLAVDRAIREIIQPVVERSVTIACITAKELIIKDFALEPGE